QADWRIPQDRAEWFFQFNADDQGLRLPGERRVDPGAGIDELSHDRRGTSRPRDYSDQAGFSVVAGQHRFLDADKEVIVDAGFRRKNQKAFFDDYAFGGMFANYVDTTLATASFTPRLKSRNNLFGLAGEATFGVDYYHSQYDSNRSLDLSTAGTPIHRLDVSQSSIAIYGQNTSDIREHAALTTGIRWQRVTMEAHDIFDSSAPGGAFGSGAPDRHSAHNEHMLNLGIRHRVNKSWSVYAKAARSVRFATVDEFFQTDPNNFLQTFSPLEPQTGESFDLGAEFAYGETRFGANIFHMNLRNEIHFNPTTFANENLDPTRRRGLTLSAIRKLSEDTRVSANYGYTRAAFREGAFAGNEVPLVPKHTGSLSMIWQVSHGLVFSAAARYTGNKRFDNDQTNTFSRIPSYSSMDIKLMGEQRPWKWQAGINNLLNKEAFDYGIRSTSSPNTYNAYPLPERNLSVSLGRDF
ncbi:MAG: TonB-dependent receptor, partial [Gammaproteobacteria bacterium]|nr:TonB-dependent receptor [Gammaproteobacteria bacterium]